MPLSESDKPTVVESNSTQKICSSEFDPGRSIPVRNGKFESLARLPDLENAFSSGANHATTKRRSAARDNETFRRKGGSTAQYRVGIVSRSSPGSMAICRHVANRLDSLASERSANNMAETVIANRTVGLGLIGEDQIAKGRLEPPTCWL